MEIKTNTFVLTDIFDDDFYNIVNLSNVYPVNVIQVICSNLRSDRNGGLFYRKQSKTDDFPRSLVS